MKSNKTSSKKNNTQQVQHSMPEWYGYLFLFASILFVAFVRIRFLSFPLERDEGEYAYFGQLILQGIPPYSIAYNMKLPGTYYCYAFIMAVFGQSLQGIRLGLLLFNIGSIVLLFFIAKKLFNGFVAAIAVFSFAIMITGPGVLGQAAHANQFVTFFMLAGILMLVVALEKEKLLYYLFSGILLALAFLAKQSALFFILFGGLILLVNYYLQPDKKPVKTLTRLLFFTMGVCFPVIVMLMIMAASGVFEKFWFWTVSYPAVYGAKIPLSQAMESFGTLFPPVIKSVEFLWITSGLGVMSLFIYPGLKQSRLFIGLLLFFSLLTVIPGFYFRPHYFIPLMPVLGILTGIFFDVISKRIQANSILVRGVAMIIFIFIVISILGRQKEYYFSGSPPELCRSLYPVCSFNESAPMARYIAENTSENDKIFIFGSEPQILFLAKRKSATGYIYMFDLVYNHKYALDMQQEMVAEVEKARPAIIVYVSEIASWMVAADANTYMLTWFNEYIKKNKYTLTVVTDIPDTGPTEYVWGGQAANYVTKSNHFIHIFKRDMNE